MRLRSRPLRVILLVIFALLPWPIKRRLLMFFFGYKIDSSASIGISVVDAEFFKMGKHATIGHLTVGRGLGRFVLDDYATVGNLNWITGGASRKLERWDTRGLPDSSFILGQHSAITHRHYIDCSDSFTIGDYSIFAGVRSQVFTHSIDLTVSRQKTRPVVIGNYCLVGTGSILLPGASLPDHSVLSAGSVLRSGVDQEWSMYSGVPAVYIREISPNATFFSRKKGFVD